MTVNDMTVKVGHVNMHNKYGESIYSSIYRCMSFLSKERSMAQRFVILLSDPTYHAPFRRYSLQSILKEILFKPMALRT